jgi:hypothetical protein
MKELWTKEGKGVIGKTYDVPNHNATQALAKFFCAMCKDELDREIVAVLSLDELGCTKAECKVLYALRT